MGESQLICPNKTGFVEINGLKIHWEYFGKGGKEVFCFINGVAMYTKSWYALLPLYLNDYDVLLFDFLGQGESSHDPVPYDMNIQCDYLVKILDDLKIQQVHMMGVSFGGMAALEFARKYSERLMTCSVSGIVATREELYILDTVNCQKLLQEASFDLFASIFFSRIFGENLARLMKDKFQYTKDKFYERYKGKIDSLIRVFHAMETYTLNTEKNLSGYRAVSVPVLVIAGEQDIYTPQWIQKKALKIFPISRFEILPSVGHVVYMENPKAFTALVKQFAKAKSINF